MVNNANLLVVAVLHSFTQLWLSGGETRDFHKLLILYLGRLHFFLNTGFHSRFVDILAMYFCLGYGINYDTGTQNSIARRIKRFLFGGIVV
ncbi:hypothetical protein D3C72_1925230 [compost metagenome]